MRFTSIDYCQNFLLNVQNFTLRFYILSTCQLIPLQRLQVVENPNLVEFMPTIEELQRAVAALISVVKDLTANFFKSLKQSATWPKRFLQPLITTIIKAFACLPCTFPHFVEIL